ncbi:MAG TPA: fibronectin type III domain-containing protein [bacterium]|nr:fibronectin type III domain-containing protein [bacterium]HPR88704.1 fibronectin type III domain-containing protein [bacterium]
MKPTPTLALGLMLFIAAGCEQINEPRRISSQDFPAAPTHLTAQVGDRKVFLAWNAPAGVINKYYIARNDSTHQSPVIIDSSAATAYTDGDLINGQRYVYRILACNLQGRESELSEPVSARPGLYSVIINEGALYTHSLDVQLHFVAPAATRYVMIAADSLLTGATWQLYAAEMNWTIVPGDGPKRVYATFLDGEGNQTGTPVADEITLDSEATIYSLELRANKAIYRTGDLIGITMRTREPYGTASVDLGEVIGTLRLFDDGTHGDAAANDGTYSHDYKLPPSKDVFDVPIVGAFTDLAGNSADGFVCAQTLTIENPPKAVILSDPAQVSSRSDALRLTWTANADADFSLYKLFRDDKAGVDSSARLVAVFNTAATNYFVDSLLVSDHEYFYRLYVCDQRGLMSGSNEVSGRTAIDAPPQAAVLQSPLNVTSSAILLSWSMNTEKDFADYRLFRGSTSAISSNDIQVALISARATTQFQDSGLLASTTYWYRLYSRDQAGNISTSNTISATTLPDEQPEAVLLAAPSASAPNALRLTWSVSRITTFASYRIFRSTAPSIDGTGTPIVIINSISATTHDDLGLTANTSYYYRVFVYDLQGRSSGSNLVYGITLP